MSMDFTARRRGRYEQLLNRLAQIRLRRTQADTNYSQGATKLDIEKPNALRNVTNQWAGRGLSFSSGHGQGVQRVNTDFANQLASLASHRQGVHSAADIEEQGENTSYNYDLADLDAQQAAYQAQQEQERVAALAAQQEQEARIAAIQAQASNAGGGGGGGGGLHSVSNPVTGQGQPTNPAAARAEFLRDHPVFAATSGAARRRFLMNHPGIASAWQRLQ